MNKTLYILRGRSGSGKSSVARALAGDYVFSADDFPLLYIDGKYQLDKQANSHSWCKRQVEAALNICEPNNVAIANTNIKRSYMDPYIELAQKYGYSVQIIQAEAVILPDGSTPENPHNTPPEIIQHQIDGYQPWSPKSATLTPKETAKALKILAGDIPNLVIADLVGTLVKPKEGKRFINQASDVEGIHDSLVALRQLFMKRSNCKLIIVSNQCGVGGGNISYQDLVEIADSVSEILGDYGLDSWTVQMLFATHRNKADYCRYIDGMMHTKSLEKGKADKPNTGLLELIIDQEAPTWAYYIGDSHVVGQNEDYQLVTNFQQLEIAKQHPLMYIPIEAVQSMFLPN